VSDIIKEFGFGIILGLRQESFHDLLVSVIVERLIFTESDASFYNLVDRNNKQFIRRGVHFTWQLSADG
jgi:hypothetical protein